MIKGEYGVTKVGSSWKVEESKPVGYSRVYHVYSGDVRYSDRSCNTQLKPGHLYLFPSNLPYKMTNDLDNSLYCLYLHLDFFPLVVTQMISMDVKTDRFLEKLLAAIRVAVEEGKKEMVYSLENVFKKYMVDSAIVKSASPPVTNALLYIAKNFAGDIGIKSLAKEAGYNPQYFIKLFKKALGITPYQYIIDFRLKKSVELLKEGKSVTEAGLLSGYKDMKTFSYGFKEKFAVSPSNYIKRSK